MTPAEIDAILDRAEKAAAGDLGTTGFWRAVAAVKRDPALVEAHADRIAAIDDHAFGAWALVRVPLGLGTAVMGAVTLVGVALLGAAFPLDAPWDGLALLAGTGTLAVSTHGLGHLAAGARCGIRFTGWFIGRGRPQPGVKIDYASYLRAPARCRAWMHAAGALVTKAVPVVALGVGTVAAAPVWALAILAVVALLQIVTDVTLSTRSGDWKKYRREMRHARGDGGTRWSRRGESNP